MGDYAPLSVLVYDVPRHLHTVVADLIGEHLTDYQPHDLLRAVAEGDTLLDDGSVNVCALDELTGALDSIRAYGDIWVDNPDSPTLTTPNRCPAASSATSPGATPTTCGSAP